MTSKNKREKRMTMRQKRKKKTGISGGSFLGKKLRIKKESGRMKRQRLFGDIKIRGNEK
jgi:hypothetical protein